MAVDLTIEVFSVDLFRNLWYKFGVKDFVPPRLKKYDEVTNQAACIDAVSHAVLCRRSFFSDLLYKEIYYDYEVYSKCGLDFYLYLQNNVTKFLPYNELSIFDKLIMSCVLVLEMASVFVAKFNTMFTYYSPLCWAMYFDTECKEEFYDKGGWRGLEIHTNSYKARVLTCGSGKEISWSARHAYSDSINIEYSFDYINRVFRENIQNSKSKASCQQCLPLFHVVRMLSGTSDEIVNEFQLTEGFLQIILRMLSQEELQKREKDFLQGTEFKNFEEIVDIGCSYLETQNQQKNEQLDDEKILYEKCIEYLEEYRVQNTQALLSRLFRADNGLNDTGEECMFCGLNVKELPKALKSVDDHQAERIKSVIYDTLIDTELKGEESAKGNFEADEGKNSGEKEDEAINQALQLFFSLGIDPPASNILANFGKRRKNQNNKDDSFAKMQTQNVQESGLKEKTRKKKAKKKKN